MLVTLVIIKDFEIHSTLNLVNREKSQNFYRHVKNVPNVYLANIFHSGVINQKKYVLVCVVHLYGTPVV